MKLENKDFSFGSPCCAAPVIIESTVKHLACSKCKKEIYVDDLPDTQAEKCDSCGHEI